MKKSAVFVYIVSLILMLATACSKKKKASTNQAKSQYPGTEEGLKQLMSKFLKDNGANA